MSPLYRFLNGYLARPFVLGECDCMLFLADWYRAVHGADPAAAIRGAYSTPGECERETGWMSDPVAAVERCLATVGGLKRVQRPAPGDVAVIEGGGPIGPFGALWLGREWGAKARSGAVTLRPAHVRPLAIWSVGWRGGDAA